MPHERSTSGLNVQTAIALVLFILGLMLLVVWAILYANRLANNLKPEWWIWFFLGFGLGLLLIGLVWLIIVQYMIGAKMHAMCDEFIQMDDINYNEMKPSSTRMKQYPTRTRLAQL